MTNVVCQKWKKSERDWGEKPDGYSLHLTIVDRNAYVREYWTEQHKEYSEAPAEYSRTCGTPYLCEVNAKTFKKVQASKNGIRIYDNKYPGDGGRDGWVAMPGGGHGKVRSANAL